MSSDVHHCSSSSNGSIAWRVIEECLDDKMSPKIEKEIEFLKTNIAIKDKGKVENLHNFFWYLYPGDLNNDVAKVNKEVEKENKSRKEQ